VQLRRKQLNIVAQYSIYQISGYLVAHMKGEIVEEITGAPVQMRAMPSRYSCINGDPLLDTAAPRWRANSTSNSGGWPLGAGAKWQNTATAPHHRCGSADGASLACA
jgi:hypothetical protein